MRSPLKAGRFFCSNLPKVNRYLSGWQMMSRTINVAFHSETSRIVLRQTKSGPGYTANSKLLQIEGKII